MLAPVTLRGRVLDPNGPRTDLVAAEQVGDLTGSDRLAPPVGPRRLLDPVQMLEQLRARHPVVVVEGGPTISKQTHADRVLVRLAGTRERDRRCACPLRPFTARCVRN